MLSETGRLFALSNSRQPAGYIAICSSMLLGKCSKTNRFRTKLKFNLLIIYLFMFPKLSKHGATTQRLEISRNVDKMWMNRRTSATILIKFCLYISVDMRKLTTLNLALIFFTFLYFYQTTACDGTARQCFFEWPSYQSLSI